MPLKVLRRSGLVAVVLVLLGAGAGFGQGPDDLALIPADAQGFAVLRVADLWKTAVVQDLVKAGGKEIRDALTEMEKKLGVTPADLERVTLVVKDSSGEELSMWIAGTSGKPWDLKTLREGVGTPLEEKKHGNITYFTAGAGKGALYLPSPRTAVIANDEKTLLACIAQQEKPATKGPLAPAIKLAAGKNHLTAGMTLPRETVNQFKQNLGDAGRPFAVLFEFESLQLVGNITGKDLEVELTGLFPAPDKAKAAKEALDGIKALARGFLAGLDDPKAAKEAAKALDSVSISVNNLSVTLKSKNALDVESLARQGFLKGLLGGDVGGAANRAQNSNNLKQIALGMFNYHDAMGQFPTSVWICPTNKQQYSWRVALLPYLEQEALYKQIVANGAWDSPANKALAAKMPKVFEMPGKPAKAGQTYYQVFNGTNTVFGPVTIPEGQMPPKVRISDITDGTSNTLGVVEAAEAVDWMKPGADIPFTKGPQGFPVKALGDHWGDNTFTVCFLDGAVRKLRRTIKPLTLQALITHQGDEVIPPGFDR
jgi:hypothetical protein